MSGERQLSKLQDWMHRTGMSRDLVQQLFDWANAHGEQPETVLRQAVEAFLKANAN